MVGIRKQVGLFAWEVEKEQNATVHALPYTFGVDPREALR